MHVEGINVADDTVEVSSGELKEDFKENVSSFKA